MENQCESATTTETGLALDVTDLCATACRALGSLDFGLHLFRVGHRAQARTPCALSLVTEEPPPVRDTI